MSSEMSNAGNQKRVMDPEDYPMGLSARGGVDAKFWVCGHSRLP